MRLLDKGNLQLDMTKLGFDPKPLDDFKWAIDQPWGMVLVTGPTGSGKTTTLYSALTELNKADANISTAEDPVEYNLARHQPGADARRDRPQLRDGPARLPAAGPGHHHGRRDPRLRDRGNRGQGGAHGPLGALDAAHQRRAARPSRACSTWASSRSSSRPASTWCSPSASPARSASTARSRVDDRSRRRLLDLGFTEEQLAATPQLMKGAGCQTCNGTRLQGPRRALRGHALQRRPARRWCSRAPRPPSSRRRRSRAGMSTPAHERHREDPRRA